MNQQHDFSWQHQSFNADRPMRIGIGGPVGSGKTELIKAMARELIAGNWHASVITNDIFTKEDEASIKRESVLPDTHVIGVETGGCPHTAVREDISMNMDAVGNLTKTANELDFIFIESGGDNLAAAFSPELADAFIYVIDVAQGEDIPRKGGPGITQSDLLIINKVDLAPYVQVDLETLKHDAARLRKHKPVILADLPREKGVPAIARWLVSEYTEAAGKQHER